MACAKQSSPHPPYVVPCIHGSIAKVEGAGDHFLHSIPPTCSSRCCKVDGRLTGERGIIPIPPLPDVREGGFYKEAWKYYQADPKGPYIYGGWDVIPPNTQTRPAHARWLKQYRPMVQDGPWAYLEIGKSSLFAGPLPKACIASAFANRDLYLVLANFGESPQQITTTDAYLPLDNPAGAPMKQWDIPKRSLRIVKTICVTSDRS